MYISFQNGKIVGYTEQPQDLFLYNLDRVEETDKEYVYDDGVQEYVLNDEDYKRRQVQKERERLDALYMTRSDFFDCFIKAFNLDPTELRIMIKSILNQINITDVEIKVALNNFDNALNFYRKHPLFTLLNNLEISINENTTLLFTSDIFDKFFDTKDYKELQKAIQVKPE